MKRRNFVGLSRALAVSPVVDKWRKVSSFPVVETDGVKAEKKQKKKIAGYSPEELLNQYRIYLFEDFLPFMEKYVIDHELGGFLWNTDRSGRNITTNKRAWYDGRGIWVYSFLYNNFRKDSSYLDTAEKTVNFVLKIKPEDKSLWPPSYTREGKELKDFPIDIYGDLFMAEGLAEFSKASQDVRYLTIAKEILLKCLNLYDSNDFSYYVDYGPEAPAIPAPRIVGHWMVLLRTSFCLLSHGPDNEIESIIRRCIDALMNYHNNPEFDLINEVLNHDLSRSEGPFSQFVYAGHVIETMWMIMYEAVRIKDKKLFDSAAEKFKKHVEVAWDDVYSGVFRALDNVDSNIWKVDKVLWEQAEVLIGALYMIEQTGDPWAYQWFEKMYRYVIETYPLKKYGYPLWNIGGDRKVTFVKEGTRIENYHHPRHLMLNILTLERIIKAGSKVVPF
jgi:mannose/cellobiose epimerase-like protein (N-acyl-D-glucosamine 2-epimerase family)